MGELFSLIDWSFSSTLINFTKVDNCNAYGVPLAIFIPLIVEAVIICIIIRIIIWKRITVAKFLLNLQLPSLREVPQLVIRKFRGSSDATPPPELAMFVTIILRLIIIIFFYFCP